MDKPEAIAEIIIRYDLLNPPVWAEPLQAFLRDLHHYGKAVSGTMVVVRQGQRELTPGEEIDQ